MAHRRRRRKKRQKRTGCLTGLAACLLVLIGTAGALVWFFSGSGGEIAETFRENVGNEIPLPQAEETAIPDNAAEEEEVSGGFYYQQLDEKERLIYREMLFGLRKMEKTIRLEAGRDDAPEKIYEWILYDRPELFWCLGSCQMTMYHDYTEFYPSYVCSEEERQVRQEEIDAEAGKCLSGIDPGGSDYDKIRAVFEYLVNTADYDEDAPDNQNIYSALVGRKTVCAGYSRAVQYLLGQLDIECIYVVGTVRNREAHAWNIVKCDGNYYHLDATFGDPVFLGAENGEELPADIIYYDYLCCTDREIMTDHTPADEVDYPPCVSDDLNYYRMNGTYFDAYDPDEILRVMNKSIAAGADTFVCKFASPDVYAEARSGLIDRLFPEAARTVGEMYGTDQVRYTYIEDEAHNKMIVLWNYQQQL